VAALIAKHSDLGELAFNFAAALQRSEAAVQAEWDEVDHLLGAPPPPPPAEAEAEYRPPAWFHAAENIILCSLAHPFSAWAQVWFDEASVPADIPRARLLRLNDLGVSPVLAAKLCQLFHTHNEVYERLLRIEAATDIRPYDGETVEDFDERQTGLVEYFDVTNAEFEAVSEELRPYRRLIDLGALLFDTAYNRSQAWERRQHLVRVSEAAAPAEVFEGDFPLHDPEWAEYLDALMAGVEAHGASAPLPVPSTFDLVNETLAFARARPVPAPCRDVATEVLDFSVAHYAAVYEARLQTEFQTLAQACEAY
jgi:hypothetical protein